MAPTSKRSGKFLSFQLGKEEYAINVVAVREIVKLQHITRVPDTPPDVRGVINLRGKVIPVVDLRLKFGIPDFEDGQRTCVIVIETPQANTGPTGVIVDEVSEVLTLGESEIQETPDFGAGVSTPLLLGLARVRDKVTILLDIELVLAASDMKALHTAVSS